MATQFIKIFMLSLMVCLIYGGTASAQTTAFTYQGKLTDNNLAANGTYDMQFRLFDMPDAGTGAQQGATFTNQTVQAINGIFTVQLDFGSAPLAAGANVYLEISIRPAGNTGGYTALAPRQQISSAPYSIQSLNATTATTAITANNSLELGGTTASVFIAGLTDSRNPLAGSGNYIQNGTSLQAASNFNVSGNGTAGATLSANTVNATTQYNIGGSRVLSVAGFTNVFAGINAGSNSNSGSDNSFFGFNAGKINTSGADNSFFGSHSGDNNTTGAANSFFGFNAGTANSTGSFNSFFGSNAGAANTTAINNSFFGQGAGFKNTSGSDNTFIGNGAGQNNTNNIANTFVGSLAGQLATASFNSFFGYESGAVTTTGNDNAFFGDNTGRFNTTGFQNTFFGSSTGLANTTGNRNAFLGMGAGSANTTGFLNTYVGTGAGNSMTTGDSNTFIGAGADGSPTINFSAAIGAGATVTTSNTIVLGRSLDDVLVPGNLLVVTLGSAGSTSLCRNALNQISTCSSSLRYKKDLEPFTSGLALVKRLNPITFRWKSDDTQDLGFAAEDVAAVEPLLTTTNADGQVEGVKYDRISAALVNAVKEQQTQIEQQQTQIKQQQNQIEQMQQQLAALKAMISKPE
jgi:hypothetical protein